MKQTIKNITTALIISLLSIVSASAIDNAYRMEFGVQAGANYLIGDPNPHIFMHPRETAGLQLRRKFDRRWSLTTMANWQRFAYEWTGASGTETIERPCISVDITGEFNFLEYGNDWAMGRIRPYTPYMFLGVGCGVYNLKAAEWDSKLGIPASLYFPFGIGFKWRIAPRWGMNIAWQHNLYFKDNLEAQPDFNNTYELNGSNILECDLTGQIMLGIVFDFAKTKKPCVRCKF